VEQKKTPEWRRGPAGPRTLCNACGLKLNKKKRKIAEMEANEATNESLAKKSKNTPQKEQKTKKSSCKKEQTSPIKQDHYMTDKFLSNLTCPNTNERFELYQNNLQKKEIDFHNSTVLSQNVQVHEPSYYQQHIGNEEDSEYFLGRYGYEIDDDFGYFDFENNKENHSPLITLTVNN